MRPVKVRQPALQVLLRKNIGRSTVDGSLPVNERFSGQQRTVDLTPYIGDQGSVRVSKSTREPAGGFTVTFADKINPDAHDTVYGLVEPMDVVEIRMAGDEYRQPQASTGGPRRLPIMMRGLVSEIHRDEQMTGDGKPQRSVVISGQDYGKIWQIIQIVNSPFVDPNANFITKFPFFARFGLSMQAQNAETFVKEVFDKVVNPYIAGMQAKSSGAPTTTGDVARLDLGRGSTSPLLTINTNGIEATAGRVSPFGTGGWQGGTIYSLLAEHCDIGPWNELYIEDREDGPYVVYRPNPFIAFADPDENGVAQQDYVMPMQSDPLSAGVRITREDIVSMTVARSDADVANYFWVGAPAFAINGDNTLRLMSHQAKPTEVYMTGYGNNDPDLYGFRRLQHQTQQGARNITSNGNGLPPEKHQEMVSSDVEWMNLRRRQLRDLNKDNVLLEHGTLRLKGNEAVRAGVYLRLLHGNMESAYYVSTVQHDYMPFRGYLTTAMVERGTGFIDRVRKGSGRASPYWAELGEE